MPIEIKTLRPDAANIRALSNLLIEAVANGAAITFMHPVGREKAEAFWLDSFVKAEKKQLFIFGAFDGPEMVGTISLVPVSFENQPNRAEVLKLIVKTSHRGQGIAKRLLDIVEQKAREINRTLLVLDTAAGSDASKLYEKTGWQICGTIPNFGYMPDGRPGGATIYWKSLVPVAP